ncbi:MAG: phosphopentomutase [Clostridia bacterium]|nr:phosphopentomutase [Clostridia bacterium]
MEINMKKRAFIIVLDSFGIGELPDAADFGDEGSHTLRAVAGLPEFNCPNLAKMGLFNIEGAAVGKAPEAEPIAAHGRMAELSKGKDTTTGHWEIAGLVSERALPTYPDGFPDEIISELERRTGKKVICNKPYSGTEVIKDYGEEHLRTGALIVYTSADSVLQIATHEKIVPLSELYRYCEIAREIMQGEHGVGRIIARPFGGEYPFQRLSGRHDYSLLPPKPTMLDRLKNSGYDVISVGKINDIFAGQGVTESHPTKSNSEGMDVAISMQDKDFDGLCFVNLVDFDMVYGHRNNAAGYANALTEFDLRLGEFLPRMKENDLLIITADHGCDPATPSTDHSREYVPLFIYGKGVKPENLGTKQGFFFVSEVVEEFLAK